MRYVAFLRAVNVGGRTIKMDRLRAVLSELPLRNIETFIASGNAIFDSSARAASLEARIETHLEDRLGLAVPTMVRTLPDVIHAARCNPFPKRTALTRAGLLYVGFLKQEPTADAMAKVRRFADEIHDFHFEGRELYWRAEERRAILRITGAMLDRALGVPVTFRSISTVVKLADKYSST